MNYEYMNDCCAELRYEKTNELLLTCSREDFHHIMSRLPVPVSEQVSLLSQQCVFATKITSIILKLHSVLETASFVIIIRKNTYLRPPIKREQSQRDGYFLRFKK
jgi:hypothetical protein